MVCTVKGVIEWTSGVPGLFFFCFFVFISKFIRNERNVVGNKPRGHVEYGDMRNVSFSSSFFFLVLRNPFWCKERHPFSTVASQKSQSHPPRFYTHNAVTKRRSRA